MEDRMNITPMNMTPCHSADSGGVQTMSTNVGERPRYYARQLVMPDDLTLEHEYIRAKMRRHNRFLHGWGVVCGARVVAAQQPWKVIIRTGYILGPYGDEICIGKDQCIDVRTTCVIGQPQPPMDDCGCTEASPPIPADTAVFLAIRYVEKPGRLVRVPLGGCGCEDSACEYSRYVDAFEICTLDHCPDSHLTPPDPGSNVRGPLPDCPQCPSEPWVVLSEFTVNADGRVTVLECKCRRQVVSFGNMWWACRTQDDRTTQPVGPAPAGPA
jgi:hypothetical protein